MLTSLREGEIPSKEDLDECMKNQVTHNCTVEAQVMLALFLLLHHVTHHAFFEDYYYHAVIFHFLLYNAHTWNIGFS
jgi:hypothetical protein